MNGFEPRILGDTGREVGPLGLGSSFGIGQKGIEEAFERGVNYLYWGSLRRRGFGRGITAVCNKDRDRAFVVVQSYTRIASLMGLSLRCALRRLKLDYADMLLLGWWQKEPPARIVDKALALKEAGLTRHIGVSTHHRPLAPTLAAPDSPFDVVHVRYNAAHRGAEKEIFPELPPREERAGLVSFTATRWGTLLERPGDGWPETRPIPKAGDCYRFVLQQPQVDCVLAGPQNIDQLREALDILEKGPMAEEELTWMREFGDAVYNSKDVKNPIWNWI